MPIKYILATFIPIILVAITATIYYIQPNRAVPTDLNPQTTLSNRFAKLPLSNNRAGENDSPQEPAAVWFTDYKGSNVKAVNRAGEIIWEQHIAFPSANEEEPSNLEFVTVAPNGNPIVTTANGMLIEELDRATHEVIWKYGILNNQYCDKCLHQPKKAFLFNDHEVLVTDANSRRVIIIDKNTNQITWEYGVKNMMKDAPGYLKGNRFAMPLDDAGSNILISDTLTKRIMVVDRQTKNILWQQENPDRQWLQSVYPAPDGGFVAEDHLKASVFKISEDKQTVWDIHTLADGTTLKYPTDVIALPNGNVLIAEAGRGRIIEVNPETKDIVWQYDHAGFVTSIAVEY